MPDWDARIHKMAGAYEFTDKDVVRIQDKNIIDGAVKTTGKVEISGTTFDGNCYIIADGDITYNFKNYNLKTIPFGYCVVFDKIFNTASLYELQSHIKHDIMISSIREKGDLNGTQNSDY